MFPNELPSSMAHSVNGNRRAENNFTPKVKNYFPEKVIEIAYIGFNLHKGTKKCF